MFTVSICYICIYVIYRIWDTSFVMLMMNLSFCFCMCKIIKCDANYSAKIDAIMVADCWKRFHQNDNYRTLWSVWLDAAYKPNFRPDMDMDRHTLDMHIWTISDWIWNCVQLPRYDLDMLIHHIGMYTNMTLPDIHCNTTHYMQRTI